MFLCATSAQKDKGDNEPYDLSPALFENELDEPVQLKNFEIELVSSVIRKDNSITITQHNNALLFRLGPRDTGEQYTALLETGVYDVNNLTTEIARALNDATPCNAWRGWGCGATGTTFEITFTTVSSPGVSSISLLSNSSFFETFGFNVFTYTPPVGNIAFYTPSYNVDGEGNAPVEVSQQLNTDQGSNQHNASYRALDTGISAVEEFTTTSVKDIGIFEGDGKIEFEIRPTEVLTEHNLYIDPGVNGVYLTLTGDYYGTPYENEDGFIGTEVLETYEGQDAQQLNGLYVSRGVSNGDIRGPPYNTSNRTMTFVADRVSEEGSIETRTENFRTTFNGNIIFNESVAIDIPNRGFQIDPDDSGFPSSTGEAQSTLHFVDEQRQNLKLRKSISPLITGTHTQNSTNITTANILVDGGASFSGTEIKYRVNTIGRMNNRQFGLGTFLSSAQGRDSLGVFKTPMYKITEVNGSGVPTKVIIVDTGEHIDTFASAGALFLNDPATFDVVVQGTATEDEIVANLCSQVRPTASDLGNAGLTVSVNRNFQYLPTEVGLVNDLIHDQITGKFSRRIEDNIENQFNPPSDADYSKDITIKITPLNFNNTAPDYVNFEIFQFQPDKDSFGDDEDEIDFTTPQVIDMEKLVGRMNPSSWNSLTYISGSSPTNWTNAFVLNATSRLKITIEQSEIFKQVIKASFSIDSGATFQEEQTLLNTGDRIAGFSTYEFTTQSRLFPLHPVFSAYPPTLKGTSSSGFGLGIRGIFTDYSNKIFRQGNRVKKYESNYLKNRDFMTSGANQPDIFTFPTTVANNFAPQIMLKTSSQGLTIVPDATALPLTAGEIAQSEVAPSNRATLGNLLNLHPAYSAQPSFVSPATFAGVGASTTKPFIPTIAVEITNLPLSGYLAKTFNVRDQRIGVGARFPIVGIIPSLEQTSSSTDPTIFFRYNTPYSQPVECRLATETFLYNLSFRLRDITTGSIIKGLQNNTELIFRIKKLEDEKKNDM